MKRVKSNLEQNVEDVLKNEVWGKKSIIKSGIRPEESEEIEEQVKQYKNGAPSKAALQSQLQLYNQAMKIQPEMLRGIAFQKENKDTCDVFSHLGEQNITPNKEIFIVLQAKTYTYLGSRILFSTVHRFHYIPPPFWSTVQTYKPDEKGPFTRSECTITLVNKSSETYFAHFWVGLMKGDWRDRMDFQTKRIQNWRIFDQGNVWMEVRPSEAVVLDSLPLPYVLGYIKFKIYCTNNQNINENNVSPKNFFEITLANHMVEMDYTILLDREPDK